MAVANNYTLSSPIMSVNNIVVSYVANSISYNAGKGVKQIRSQDAGGGNVVTVFSEDASTKMGKVMASFVPTSQNIELISGWLDNNNSNFITLTDSKNGFTLSFSNACVVNNPDVALGFDSQIDVEFQSDPAV